MKNKEKNLLLNETKEYEKNSQKVFTKKKAKDIIIRNHKPLKVNCKIYRRGSVLYSMEDMVLNDFKKELSLKYGRKEKVFEILFQKCKELNYNINESKEIIIKFYKDKLLVQNLSIDLEK